MKATCIVVALSIILGGISNSAAQEGADPRSTCPAVVELNGATGAPFAGPASDARVMSVYPASEFACDGGSIFGMSFYMIGSYTMNDLTIRLHQTGLTALISDSFLNTGWTTCYQASTPISPGWQTFIFTTPFTYTASGGAPNLLVDISYNSSTPPSKDVGLVTYTTTDLRSLVKACNNCMCGGLAIDPLSWTTCTGCARWAAAPRVRFLFGGACCQPNGDCAVTWEANCTGTWHGLGTSCNPSPCPQPGACCFADGHCELSALIFPGTCGSEGEYKGDGTTCWPNPCVGACCSGDGTCRENSSAQCASLGGVYQGDGTTCGPNPCPPASFAPAAIVAWGDDSYGQSDEPTPNIEFRAIAAGYWHTLGLKADGSLVAWGGNYAGQCNIPSPNGGFVAVSSCMDHSLGLKVDGSIVAWGWNRYGQCDVPSPNSGFVAVAAGGYHSMGLKSDGSVVAWGDNYSGQCNVPAPNSGFIAIAASWYHSMGLKADGSIVVWGTAIGSLPSPNSGFVAIAAGGAHSMALRADGSIAAWGNNSYEQCTVPAPNSDFVAIAGGGLHSVGLKADGSIVAWGSNQDVYDNYGGQCNLPSPNSHFAAIAAGAFHTVGLKAPGSIAAWGYNGSGECTVPAPNSDFVAVAGGDYHTLGVKADGSIVAWGNDNSGQCNVPSPNTGFVAVTGGDMHSLGLRADGSIVAWGDNSHGQCNVPSPNTGFVAVAAGYGYSLGLKADGSIRAWGDNSFGQCNVPSPDNGFVAVAGGFYHSLGLKADGSIVAWGHNGYGQCNVPSPNSGFVAVAGGCLHSLGLKADGSITAWGHNGYGQCTVPSPNSGFVAVARGYMHSLGLKANGSITAWGYNGYGECTVPTPNSGFIAVAGGVNNSLALRVFSTGACCFADGHCESVRQPDCTGTWQGEGTNCSPNSCPQPGACCFGDGHCEVVAQAACGGTWLGLGTTCSPNSCPFVKGDLNCDHAVTMDDVPYFAGALIGDFTGCELALADMNCDGVVNGLDVAPFLAALVAGIYPSCPPPPEGMVLIPAGEFQMGDTFNEGYSWELPVHAVDVDAFYMDTSEVTNQQYADALNWAYAQGNLITVVNGVVLQEGSTSPVPYCSTTSAPTGYPNDGEWSRITWNGSTFGVVAGRENHPMTMVSWYGSVAYANWRSGMQAKPLCYDLSTWTCNFGSGYRLPTEAEWEKAARGGAAGHRFPWSDSDDIQHARAAYCSDATYSYDTSPTRGFHPLWIAGSSPYTTPVGFFTGAMQYRADWAWPGAATSYQTASGVNGYGLCDMADNVSEWCNDWISLNYYIGSPYNNPHGPAVGGDRVLRGGSWGSLAFACVCAYRGQNPPEVRSNIVGFRLALDFE